MKGMFRRREREVPGLNTAALPDLIFTVLFFFMIVTHMRQTDVQVKYQVPQGTEVEKLAHKSAVQYIYIGRPANAAETSAYLLQLNGRIVSAEELEQQVVQTRDHMAPEDRERMTVSIRADRQVPMGIVADVKQALRRAGALKIHYSATEQEKE